jgi:hypothetical protein
MTTDASPSTEVFPKPVRAPEPPTIKVDSYDHGSDTVVVVFRNGRTHFNYRFIIPAAWLPNLTGEQGKPWEYLDREFVVTQPG